MTGQALHVHAYGPAEAPPLLAMHGVTGHGRRFERMAQEQLPERRVLAVDLRGHGRSTWDPPWTAEQHVADLLATLHAAGVEHTDVLGHSFGGLLATALAATAPERVRRLVLLDPAIALPPAMAREEAEEMRADESWATLDEAKASRSEGRTPQAAEAARADVDQHIERGPDGRFRMRYSACAVIAAWSEMARPPFAYAGIPTLLVTAGRADYVTDPVRRSLGRLGDEFREVVLDADHIVYWDDLEGTARLVREFLAPG